MDFSTFSIFTGDQKVMPLGIAYGFGRPVDLTSCTEIVVNLPNADGSFAQLKLTTSQVAVVSPATSGQFNTTIIPAVSALLNIGEQQDIDVTFTISGNPTTVRFYKALSVFETQ